MNSNTGIRHIITGCLLGWVILPAQAQAAQPVPATTKPSPQPSLVVVEKEMDLGKIPSTSKTGFKVHLKNRGTKPVKLTRVSAPCGCTAVAPTLVEMAPGQEIEIPVTFDPHGYFATTTKQLDFASDDPARPAFTWHFRADVQSPTIPQPKALGLNMIEGIMPSQEASFRFVPARTALHVKSLAFEDTEGLPIVPKLKWHMEQGEARGTLTLDQKDYTPEVAAQERTLQRHARLVLTTTDGGSDWIDVYWRFDGFVWSQPSSISLGEIPYGEARSGQAFLAWRLPVKNARVTSIQTTTSNLSATVEPYANTTQIIKFTYKGNNAGRFAERVRLTIDAEDTTSLVEGAPAKVKRIVYLTVSGIVTPATAPAKPVVEK